MTAEVQFGKVPTDVIRSGALGGLGRSELAVYLVLAGHANGKSFEARPGVPTIARLAAMSERNVRRATARLKTLGLLVTTEGRGRGHVTTYRLVTKPAAGVPFSEGENRTPHVRFSAEKRGRPAPKKRTSGARKADTACPTEQRRTEKNSSSPRALSAREGNRPPAASLRPAGAAGVEDDDPERQNIRDALVAAGIGEPTRGELAAAFAEVPNAAATIRDVAASARESGKGAGATVLALRDKAASERVRAAERDLARKRQAENDRRREQEVQLAAVERRLVVGTLRALPGAELQALIDAALAAMPEMVRRQVGDCRDVFANGILRAFVWRAYQAASDAPGGPETARGGNGHAAPVLAVEREAEELARQKTA